MFFAVVRAILLRASDGFAFASRGDGLLLRPATEDLMSNGKSTGAVTVGVECIIPILRVNSVTASIRFYVDVLGFKVDWGGDDSTAMASVSRGGKAIMLCQGEAHTSPHR